MLRTLLLLVLLLTLLHVVVCQVVINNAGVYGPQITLETVKAEDMLFTYQANTIGPLLVVQQLLKNKLIGAPGSLVGNVTSKAICDLTPSPPLLCSSPRLAGVQQLLRNKLIGTPGCLVGNLLLCLFGKLSVFLLQRIVAFIKDAC